MYDVASVDTDTQITLSVNYAGVTASGAVYAIGTSFTVPDNFPEMSQGDIETATIFTRGMRKIQSKFTALVSDISGKADIAGQTFTGDIAAPNVSAVNTCKAWVNFDGTGTVAIRDSYNISSITDTATGNYNINFVSDMNNANYSVTTSTIQSSDASANYSVVAYVQATELGYSSLLCRPLDTTDSKVDLGRVLAQVFSN